MKTKAMGVAAGVVAVAVIGAAALMKTRGPSNGAGGQPVQAAQTAEPEQQPNNIRLEPGSARLADLQTTVVRRGDARNTLRLSGTCEVDQDRVAKVTAPVSGRITRLMASPGRTVGAGEVVAVIESVELADARKSLTEAISARDGAVAQIGVAQAKVAAARRTLDRQREFQRSGAFAQKPVEEAEAELASAQADVRTAESEHERAQSELARTQELFKSEIVARRDVEAAQAEEKVSRARLEAATEKVRIARQALSREQTVSRRNLLNRKEVGDAETELRLAMADLSAARVARASAERAIAAARENVAVLGAAPSGKTGSLTVRAAIGGVVLDREVTLGQSVERGAEICEVANTGSVWVIGNAYEKNLSRLSVGQPVSVRVTAYPETSFAGRVTQIGTVLDETSRTVRVRCQVANPSGKLHPGMFAQLDVLAGEKAGALLVPEAAVQEDADAKYVFVVKDGAYRRVPVRLGEAANGFHEVLSGLRAGDTVVAEGSFILKSESKKSEMEGD